MCSPQYLPTKVRFGALVAIRRVKRQTAADGYSDKET